MLPLSKLSKTQLKLYPKQAQAMFSKAQERLYGGAKGGGKSHFLRCRFIYLALLIPGLQEYLFRRLFPELIANHMRGPQSFPKMLAPLVDARLCHITTKRILFFNGAQINLCHCQYEKSVDRYQGVEIHVLGIDEITHWTLSMYQVLRSSCRVSGIVIPEGVSLPEIDLTGNPGGCGHIWVKEGWVDYGIELHTASIDDGGMTRQFIPAKATDNPSLLRDDPTYLQRLEGMGDKMLVRAMRDGDWNIVAGAKFGQLFRRERHICHPFPIPEGWEIWRGADDGWASPAACYWLTQNPDTKTYYVIQELYRTGMRPEVYGETVMKMDKEIVRCNLQGDFLNETSLQGMMDSAAFSDTGTGEEKVTRGEQINKKGCRFRPVEKFPGSKVARVQNFCRVLDINPHDPKGGPGIVFFDTCTMAIKTIPAIPTNPRDIEDTDPDFEQDHCFIGSTLVETETGPRRIDEIKKGDLVWTRLGLAPVLATWETHGMPVIDKMGLTATPGHRIKADGKWTELAILTPSHMLCRWPNQKSLSLTELLFDAIQNLNDERTGYIFALILAIERERWEDSMKKSGVPPMVPFHQVITSITETRTRSTMKSRIWNALRRKFILSGISRHRADKHCATIFITLRKRLRNGIDLPKEENGTVTMGKRSLKISSQSVVNVSNAESLLKQLSQREPSFARMHACQKTVENPASTISKRNAQSVENRSGQINTGEARHAPDPAEQRLATVYNLTIDGAPEFYANGVLVANCFDGVTYGLQWRKSSFKRGRVTGI